MNTQTLVQKLDKEINEIKHDIREMKEFLFAPLQDAEGTYKESFVKKMLARSQNGDRVFTFSDKKSFLKHVRTEK